MDIRHMIDHTLLRPEASAEDIDRLCDEAAENGLYAVCVNPCRVKRASARLAGTGVKVAAVIGFPLGASTSETKRAETAGALADGADEIDMVMNIGALKDGDLEYVKKDIEAVVSEAGVPVKVIIETCLLTDEEKARASLIVKDAGAAMVKTSTGFGSGGAAEADVRLIRETVGPDMGIKASGGIRSKEEAEAMIRAGADRIGTSRGTAMI